MHNSSADPTARVITLDKGVAVRFFGRNQPLIHQFLDVAVVTGQLLQVTFPQSVNPAVPHPQTGALAFISR